MSPSDPRAAALDEAALVIDGMADLYARYAVRQTERAGRATGTERRLAEQQQVLFERDCITLRDAANRIRELKEIRTHAR